MATISACTPTSSIARAPSYRRRPPCATHHPFSFLFVKMVTGPPSMSKIGKVSCSVKEKAEEKESRLGMGASLMAGVCAAAMSSPAAMALVDERLSTEGTGLPFGLSNNLLVWILLGVFVLIWSLYFVYTLSLEEDEESGLSL